MKTMTKKAAKDLQAGDVIATPAQERGWLKSNLTVVSVSEGHIDKGGLWLVVKATFLSPYSDKETSGVWCYRPGTLVRCL